MSQLLQWNYSYRIANSIACYKNCLGPILFLTTSFRIFQNSRKRMVTVVQTQTVPLSPQCMALSHIVTCHILHAAFHLSPVTCRMSLSLTATATDPPHGNAMQRPKKFKLILCGDQRPFLSQNC